MQLIKSTLLISVLVTIGLGCKPPKDETPSPSTGPVLDKIVWYTDDGIQGTIWYNSDSSIRQIERKTDENYLQKISVANDSLYVLTYIDNQLFDEESNTFPIKNGKIYSIDNAVASYNSEGYLSEINLNNTYINSAYYQNGNLIATSAKNQGVLVDSVQFGYYDTLENKLNLLTGIFNFDNTIEFQRYAPYFGKANKNLIKSLNENGEIYEFKYQLNGSKQVTKVTIEDGLIIINLIYHTK